MICPATPVHAPPMPRPASLSSLPYVQRGPFFGMLFAMRPAGPGFTLYTHGTAPNGSSMKILWIVRRTAVDRLLVVRARQLDGAGSWQSSFQRAGSDVPGANYPSIIDLPAPGCWRLDLSTRGFEASFVVRAVDP